MIDLTNEPAQINPNSPLPAMAQRLQQELSNSQGHLKKSSDYYDGEQPLLYSSDKWRTAFGSLFRDFADNWCQLVVDAVEERLDVTGFRMGRSAKSGDDAAWSLWQANDMDAQSQIAHTEVLIYGRSYIMVWGDDDTGDPVITVESPSQMIVANSATNRRLRLAALKRWVDDDGFIHLTYYTPNLIGRWISKHKQEIVWSARSNFWQPGENEWVYVDETPNPLQIVPVVPLINKPRLRTSGVGTYHGVSEMKLVMPMQDAVNKLLLDMMIASEFGSFRQRWVTGIEVPEDPETHQPIEPFKAAVDRLWISEDANTKFGEFGQTDLGPYVSAIELCVQHIASQTRTPPHYFYLGGSFPSGESIKSAETGLVNKAKRKIRHFSDSWEEVMRLCFAVQGDPRANITDSETIWKDPETFSEGAHIDALVKKQSIGVPNEQLWEDAGYSPQQIARFRVLSLQSAVMQRLSAPLGQQAPTQGQPVPSPAPPRQPQP